MSRAPDQEPASVAALIIRTGRAIAQVRDAAVARHGLTSTSMGALAELTRSGGASHRELAARLGVAPATLTPAVDALERTGDVVRERDPLDRRVVRVAITVRGRERFAAAAADVDDVLRARVPDPSPEQDAGVRAHLSAVLVALRPGP